MPMWTSDDVTSTIAPTSRQPFVSGQLDDRRHVRDRVGEVGHHRVADDREAVDGAAARVLDPLDLLRLALPAERARREAERPAARAARHDEPVLGRGRPRTAR